MRLIQGYFLPHRDSTQKLFYNECEKLGNYCLVSLNKIYFKKFLIFIYIKFINNLW